MTRSLERNLRTQLSVSILLVWLGITLCVYGLDPGGPIVFGAMLWLAACIHRLGRSGDS